MNKIKIGQIWENKQISPESFKILDVFENSCIVDCYYNLPEKFSLNLTIVKKESILSKYKLKHE